MNPAQPVFGPFGKYVPAAANEECGPRVVVVDDERDIREGCDRILTRMGCEVETFDNGEDALESIEERPAQVVLLDLKMPGLDGMAVMARVLEMDPATSVIIVTGYATLETAIQALKKGAYDFLAKPFEPAQLRMAVSRALDKQCLQEHARRLEEERRRNLADLDKEKSRIHTILEALPTGLLVTNSQGRVVLMNPAFRRLLNLPDSAGPGGEIREYVADEGLCRMVADVSLCSLVPDETPSRELALPGGRFLLARARPVMGEKGECLGAVVVLSDVTALKILDRLKDEFVAKVSHELRSPLSTIHEQISLVLEDVVRQGSQEDQQLLSRAREKTGALISLIGDLLDVSRIEAGVMAEKTREVDLEKLLQGITDFFRDKARSRGQTLVLSVTGPLPPLTADPLALESIFGNLVTNALAYTQDGGRIEVLARPEEGGVAVAVRDNGYGMEARHLTKIFEKFYRVKTDKTRHIPGTGLGLSIVRALLDRQGGRIEVESEPDRGSTFTVRLPGPMGVRSGKES